MLKFLSFFSILHLKAHEFSFALLNMFPIELFSFYLVNLCSRYLEASGIPEEFVQLLAENYTGTAQAANLLADWLIVAGNFTCI